MFQGDQGVVVQLKEVGQIRRGFMDFQATLINLTDKPKTLNVKVSSNSGELASEEQVCARRRGEQAIRLRRQNRGLPHA